MDEKMYPPLIGDMVTVKVPTGLPVLMMNVTREVLRDTPAEGQVYSYIADYLECLLKEENGKDGLMEMMVRLAKTDEEKYLDTLKTMYTVDELNKLATIVQRGWKYHKVRLADKKAAEFEKAWKSQMTPEETLKRLKDLGVPLKAATRAVTLIQRCWREHRRLLNAKKKSHMSVTKSSPKKPLSTTDSMDEIDYENDSDDLERVNVVRVGQRDYVPPIPDYIDGVSSIHEDILSNPLMDQSDDEATLIEYGRTDII